MSELDIFSKQFDLGIRLFGLLRLLIFNRAKAAHSELFLMQQSMPETQSAIKPHLTLIRGCFVKYAMSRTVAIEKIDGEHAASDANTMDYEEFVHFLRDAQLLETKHLMLSDVYSIFAAVDKEESDSMGDTTSVSLRDVAKVKQAIAENRYDELELEEQREENLAVLRFPDFVQALKSIASFRFPNPYDPVKVRIEKFMEQEFLPWAKKEKLAKFGAVGYSAKAPPPQRVPASRERPKDHPAAIDPAMDFQDTLSRPSSKSGSKPGTGKSGTRSRKSQITRKSQIMKKPPV